MGGVAVYVGSALLIAAGGAAVIWPGRIADYLTHDDDGSSPPATPGAARRTRLAGVALIALAAVLIWYGPDAFRGPADVGVP